MQVTQVHRAWTQLDRINTCVRLCVGRTHGKGACIQKTYRNGERQYGRETSVARAHPKQATGAECNCPVPKYLLVALQRVVRACAKRQQHPATTQRTESEMERFVRWSCNHTRVQHVILRSLLRQGACAMRAILVQNNSHTWLGV